MTKSLLTDVAFLYQPSQIALTCLLMGAEEEEAEALAKTGDTDHPMNGSPEVASLLAPWIEQQVTHVHGSPEQWQAWRQHVYEPMQATLRASAEATARARPVAKEALKPIQAKLLACGNPLGQPSSPMYVS